MKQRASVHRFREDVAIYVGNGETVYIPAKEARKLARAINRAAKSCETETFAESSVGTLEIEWSK
jgi:hypothetical protein